MGEWMDEWWGVDRVVECSSICKLENESRKRLLIELLVKELKGQ